MTPAPLTILSAPHSGAATVAAALGNHPAAIALPELHLMHTERIADLLQLFGHTSDRIADGLLRCIAELYCGGQTEDGIAQARTYLERRADWTTAALLDQIIESCAPRTVILHDTASPLRVTDLDRCFDAIPWGAFLHLQRHPLHFSRDAREHLSARLDIPPDYKDHGGHNPRIDPQLMWYRVHDTIARELQARSANGMRTRSLRLEDLYAAPGDALAALCAWTGWHCDSETIALMMGPPRGPFAARGPRSAPGGFEMPAEHGRGLVVPLSERQRAPWSRDSGFATEVRQLARQLGYS